jgi:aryl-alcohol dehydrogenase-like predicted oxidoreductase
MQIRALGDQGLEVSAIGLGTMGMSISYGPSDDNESIATIRHAFERGVTLFDTAEIYGRGRNEQLLGKAVEGFRSEISIATKFGYDFSGARPSGFDSRPEHIRNVTDRSLALLNTDYIDLLYQHRPDPDVPIEDVAGAVKELIDAGKVRYFGLSEAGPENIRRAHQVQPVSALQTEYSMFERAVEEHVLPVVRQLGIGFVAYSPLGRGLLTSGLRPGKDYSEDDYRRKDERFQDDNFAHNSRIAENLRAFATAKGITLAQLGLAWLLHQGPDIVPIPGTRNAGRLEENLGASQVVLSVDELNRIRELLPSRAFGNRYPAGHMPTDW